MTAPTPERIKIWAGGRELSILGTVPSYLKSYDGRGTDAGSIAQATKGLPNGSLCIDVGANIGIMALSLAVQRPDCQIVAIEPVPDNFTCLQQNIADNRIRNVEAINAAVGDRAGTLSITNNGPWSSVSDAVPDTVRCRCATLDEFGFKEIAFLKIDTEGYEPNVLAGASRVLFSRPLVYLEFNTFCFLTSRYDPIAFATALWNSCEILGVYHHDQLLAAPASSMQLVHDNIVYHNGVADLLLRPKAQFPMLVEMTHAPGVVQLQRRIKGDNSDHITIDDQVIIEALYTVFLGRSPDPIGAANCLNMLKQGLSHLELAFALMGSQEYIQRQRKTGNLMAPSLDSHS
jgi:FkbM family methyltransferase